VLQYVSFGSGLGHALDNNPMDTNYVETGNAYDEFIGLSGGLPVLCNGPAWTSAAVRSLALEVFDGVLANQASFTCNSGAGQSISCPEDNCTYIGTFYALGTGPSPNGQITFNPTPVAARGGASAVVGIWNAYNRVPLPAVEQDNASPYGTRAVHVWEVADSFNSGTNNILVVDGYQQTPFDVVIAQVVGQTTGTGAYPQLSVDIGAPSTCAPAAAAPPVTFTSQQIAAEISVSYSISELPRLGLQCVQAVEYASTTAPVFNTNSALVMRLNWQY